MSTSDTSIILHTWWLTVCSCIPIYKVPHIWTFKLQTFKDVNVHSHVQSHELVHVSSILSKSLVSRLALLDLQDLELWTSSQNRTLSCVGELTIHNIYILYTQRHIYYKCICVTICICISLSIYIYIYIKGISEISFLPPANTNSTFSQKYTCQWE